MEGLIINADDFGRTVENNEGIRRCFDKGIIDYTSIMMNMEATEDAIKISKEMKIMDRVGLHINLTEGYPLTELIKSTQFCDEGKFNQRILYLNNRFHLTNKEKRAICIEIDEQCKRYVNAGFSLLHADSHQHVHTNVSLYRLCLRILKAYNFESIRLARNIPAQSLYGLKGLYKRLLNARFRLFNKGKWCTLFGSKKDFYHLLHEKGQSELPTEIMIHPLANENGIVADSVDESDIISWYNDLKSDLVHIRMRSSAN